jgi:serine/threonine-protein kinase
MGEVYRANDLLLGQTVALKFLPAQWTSDEPTLSRFRNEVRIARQVSHPNVCRVYDIGETDGSTYLSMEYVDGEDLASLLRRIGRLPPDKALEISRQLCAGLAAAHDKGVVHRDLKPGNIMLDGQGHLRITDFGLAGVAGELKDIRSGTPAYLSPEQRSGQEVTARSDIYALGVVLHEVFTGKRPSSDSSHPDLAPDVDRVIRRCLAEEPAKRPTSALQVAAALPGGDPLAAALAAGETPSPEMVAASGESKGLPPIVAWALLAGVAVSVIAAILMGAQTQLYRRVPLEKTPEVLAERARNILQSVGYTDPPEDTAMGTSVGYDFLRYVKDHDKSKKRWDNLETGAIAFWYRGSPRPLVVHSVFPAPNVPPGSVLTDDPGLDVSGMTLVQLNPLGRLTQLIAVPPQVENPAGAAPSPDWASLFSAAGLDLSKWSPSPPAWTPPVYSDARAAWTGSLAERPLIPMRIEAAAYRGKPVYFELIGPWTRPEHVQPDQPATAERVSVLVGIVLLLSMLLGSAMLARRNLRLGRGDRQGASRLAAFVFAASAVAWVSSAHHVPSSSELGLFMGHLVWWVYFSCFIWVLYVALEPYVRRRWPATLISWSRLLAGGFRDPLVGRHLLVGCLSGAFSPALLDRLGWFVPLWLGYPPEQPRAGSLWPFFGPRTIIGELATAVLFAPFFWLAILFVLVLLRALLRKTKLAAVGFVLLIAVLIGGSQGDPALVVAGLVFLAWGMFLLIRFGLLAGLANTVIYHIVATFPLTTQGSAWYWGISLTGILLIAALTLYGFYTSLGGRPIFGSAALEE